jgi:hypothetical protein
MHQRHLPGEHGHRPDHDKPILAPSLERRCPTAAMFRRRLVLDWFLKRRIAETVGTQLLSLHIIAIPHRLLLGPYMMREAQLDRTRR